MKSDFQMPHNLNASTKRYQSSHKTRNCPYKMRPHVSSKGPFY